MALFWFTTLALAGGSATLEKGIVFKDDASGIKIAGHFTMDQQLVLDPTTGEFSILMKRLRPGVKMDFGSSVPFPLRARCRLELAKESPAFLDSYADMGPKKYFIRVGRFSLPTGRAQLTSSPTLMFTGFSPMAAETRVGRDFGAMGTWKPGPFWLQTSLTGNGFDEEVGWRGVARAAVDIANGVPYNETSALSAHAKPGLSVGGHVQYWTIDESFTVALEMAAQSGPLRFQAEGFVRGEDERGGYVHASTTLVPDKLDFGIRADRLILADLPANTRVEGVISGYVVGPHIRLQAIYMADLVETALIPGVQVNGQIWF